MKIAVNTRLFLPGRLEGIGWFMYENLSRITRWHPEHWFYFIFDRKWDDSFVFGPNVEPVAVPPQARHPLLYYTWFEFSLPLLFRKIKPDLFFSPDGYLSLRTRVPSVNVFHDLNFEHYPKDLPWHECRYYRHFFPKYARKALRIATVSEYSKQDIVNQYGVEPEKIDVVYNGANESFKPLTAEEKSAARQKFTGGIPYFVFVGALHPRKNLVNLFKAFDLFRARYDQPFRLLIVGEKMWWTAQIRQAYQQMKYRDEVIFSGRLDLKQLVNAVGAAEALTYVSYFEGFGIPIVEAFRTATPVITSGVTSMPEVAGDAALITDPFSPDSIAGAMLQIARDPATSEMLSERGLKRAELFTWDQSAQRLWKTIEKALETK